MNHERAMNDETYRQLVEGVADRLCARKAGQEPCEIHRNQALLGVDAALSAPQLIECETCGAKGHVGPFGMSGHIKFIPKDCPDCVNGYRSGPSILVERAEVEGRYEQAEIWTDQDGRPVVRTADRRDVPAPYFVLRAPQETNQ